MNFRATILFVFALVIVVSAYPSGDKMLRERRDVLESVDKTLSDAGDAVVNIFKPTEKSVLDKMADGVKNIAP